MSRYESYIEQQIRLAQERGDFDDLPGLGKPLPDRGEQDDELWWVKDYLRREGVPSDALLPQSLQLAKQIERLPETVRGLRSEDAVREVVAELNQQVVAYLQAPSGPLVPVHKVNADEVVAAWRDAQPPPPEPAPPPPAVRRRWWGRSTPGR